MKPSRVPGPKPSELPLVVERREDGLDRAERRVLREAVLALSGGRAPTVDDLARGTGLPPDRVRDVLRTLDARDCVALKEDQVRLAYPFTTDDVAHEVVSSRGVARTCCAIDALGVGAMLGEIVEVRSRCAYCGAPIGLRGRDRFEGSEGAVVFLPPADLRRGKAIDSVCPSMNLYCNRDHGRAHAGPWADRGRFVSVGEATDLGVALFGNLLRSLEGTADAEVDAVHERVRERYTSAAVTGRGCGRDASCCMPSDYSAEELARIPAESNLGLGSGSPVRHAALKPGEVVLDLGSGAGVDVFLAANAVGPTGRAIGVDMTPEMVARARFVAERDAVGNAEFRHGAIERLPVESASVDVVLSNCVINLSPDKAAVFREAFRVLKPGGRLVVSDIVQERPLGRIDNDCGCVATAMVRGEYMTTIRDAGFMDLNVVEDRPWLMSPAGRDASAITLRAFKTGREVTS